jgi:hypothetical protein
MLRNWRRVPGTEVKLGTPVGKNTSNDGKIVAESVCD